MTASRAPRVADPRQSPFDRAMYGVKTVTVKEREKIIESAKKRYMAAMKAREAAARRARR